MSIPQFKETVSVRIQAAVEHQAAFVVEGTQMELDRVRLSQGVVQGLRLAQRIIDEYYKENYG